MAQEAGAGRLDGLDGLAGLDGTVAVMRQSCGGEAGAGRGTQPEADRPV